MMYDACLTKTLVYSVFNDKREGERVAAVGYTRILRVFLRSIYGLNDFERV